MYCGATLPTQPMLMANLQTVRSLFVTAVIQQYHAREKIPLTSPSTSVTDTKTYTTSTKTQKGSSRFLALFATANQRASEQEAGTVSEWEEQRGRGTAVSRHSRVEAQPDRGTAGSRHSRIEAQLGRGTAGSRHSRVEAEPCTPRALCARQANLKHHLRTYPTPNTHTHTHTQPEPTPH